MMIHKNYRRFAEAVLGSCCFLLCAAPLPAQNLLDRLQQQLQERQRQQPDFQVTDEPGYLGVIADDRNENGQGIRILESVEGGPADRGGLEEDDLVVAVNGRAVRQMSDLGQVLQNSRVGQVLQFDIVRNQQRRRVNVVLGRRPDPENRELPFGRIPGQEREGQQPRGGDDRDWTLGVTTRAIDNNTRAQLRLPSTLGALIEEVVVDSPASEAGLKPNDAIVAVDGFVINRPSDLQEVMTQMKPGDEATLSFYRGGRFMRAKVSIPENPTRRPERVEEIPPPPRRPDGDNRSPSDLSTEERIEVLESVIYDLSRRVAELEEELAREKSADGKKSPPVQGPSLPPISDDDLFRRNRDDD